MPDFSRDERLIVDYLLGNLPEAEAGHLDELSVADDEFVEFLEQVENDLIDDYVRGELSEEKRTRFESYYLASVERRKRVGVARTFVRYVDNAKGPIAQTPASRPHYLQWGSIAAALLISLVAGYFLIENVQLRRDLAQQRWLDRQKQKELAAEKEKFESLETAAAPPKLFAFQLSPQYRDIAAIPKMKIPAATESVVVTLKFESDDFPFYQTVLKNPATDEILWRSDNEKSRQNSVVIQFPANLLKSQDYILEVFGISKNGQSEIIGGYPFQVLIQ